MTPFSCGALFGLGLGLCFVGFALAIIPGYEGEALLAAGAGACFGLGGLLWDHWQDDRAR